MASPAPAEIDMPDMPCLLERSRGGDTAAFGELCRLHEPRLLRQAFTLCGDSSLAEDLAQDTLLEAWKSLARYDGRCQFFTWLCAILLHRYRNLRRRQRPFPFSVLWRGAERVEERLDSWPDPTASPDAVAQCEDQATLVRRCVQALPAKQQQVIYLRFYVDHSIEGIAAALGCSIGTVKSRLFHALEKLRHMKDFKDLTDL